ncbi:MAG: Verru_Chthon cassette protein A [Verrucomicrobiae bacterium]|nr:Verru_Chthon cassette protein A [Verrucomicrobiae bacterium]
MKTHPKPLAIANQPEKRRGVALITVLTIISLCTILILTFFQLAQNEMIASDSYNSGIEAQQVAEQAVNLVIKQIREATSDSRVAWASQPGAIRRWNNRGFESAFKLYSDDLMVEKGSERNLVSDDYDDLRTWDSKPWQYVDLNEPVIRGQKVYYPIVDPSARTIPDWSGALGQDRNGIEGFFLLPEDSGAGFLSNIKGNVPKGAMSAAVRGVRPADGVARDTLPMPVKWIYQLKDGTLGVLDNGQRFQPVNGGNSPSASNPMVARFAFWTDDETCKLNPNVHAGGATWTTPMASGMIDRNLGRFQPTQHEWQRYPGHPATTHLAPVLAPGIPDITYKRDSMEMIFALVPRVVGGGSVSGTKKVDFNNPQEANGLVADTDRLYATLDEFFLEPGPLSNMPNRSQTMRDVNNFPDASAGGRGSRPIDWEVMQDHAERTKFFLSVVSRAPETTMFNTPRVSMWPTHYDLAENFTPARWTPFDRLIRFCAELGGGANGRFKYHFQRFNADSASDDLARIDRNVDLMKYLDLLTLEKVPGFGKSFEEKYGSIERRQIITEIFDYIRCSNLHDDSLFGEDWKAAFSSATQNRNDHITYTNGRIADGNSRYVHKGHGQVTPISVKNVTGLNWDAKGFGRFYTMLEMGVLIINCADGGDYDAMGVRDLNRLVGAARLSNPGTTKYNQGWIENPAPRYCYSNIPPLGGPDAAVVLGALSGKQGLEGEDLAAVARDEKNWNWQLAWLDPAYEAAMPEQKFKKMPSAVQCWLKPEEQCLQAALVWNMFSPSLGWVPISPDMFLDIQIQGMTFQSSSGTGLPGGGANNTINFGWSESSSKGVNLTGLLSSNGPGNTAWVPNDVQIQSVWHDRHYGGNKPFTYFLTGRTANRGTPVVPNEFGVHEGIGANGRYTPLDYGYNNSAEEGDREYNKYYYVTKPFRNQGETVTMEEGLVTIKIWSADSGDVNRTLGSAPQPDGGPREEVQKIEIKFPKFEVPIPVLAEGRNAYINEFNRYEPSKSGPMEYWSLSRDGSNPVIASRGRISKVNGSHGGLFSVGDVVQSVAVRHGDTRLVAAMPEVLVPPSQGGTAPPPNPGDPDPEPLFMPHANYGNPLNLPPANSKSRMAHGFTTTPGWRFAGADQTDRSRWLVRYKDTENNRRVYHSAKTPYLMPYDESKYVQQYGDFDNGFGNVLDGAYINKPDEGNTHSLFKRTDPNALVFGNFEMARDYGDFPYFVRDWIHEAGTPSYFSPNRIISSPGQLGSLTVGSTNIFKYRKEAGGEVVFRGEPWRTLLFRPDVEGGKSPPKGGFPPDDIYYRPHPGAASSGALPDHLLMDLFWMPVVEPYAISEPLSTAGKVNLNYQILPFRNIHRSTAIRGVFKSEYMLCVPNQWVPDAKVGIGRGQRYHWRDNPYGGTLESKSLRTVILEDETLAQFEDKFNRDYTLFKAASEICEMHLVPQDIAERTRQGGSAAQIGTYTPSLGQMKDGSYWADHATVGDNAKERNYSNIYARITTKSNTFKVFYRAEVLKKANVPGNDPGRWDVLTDQVVAEYRGSSVVERYVEPNDKDIPDYTTASPGKLLSVDRFYKYRVVSPTRFAP